MRTYSNNDKTIVRNNLTNLPFNAKRVMWNLYSAHYNLHKSVIVYNNHKNIVTLSKMTGEDPLDVVLGEFYNKEDEYLIINEECNKVTSVDKFYASAVADTNLRIEFTDAVCSNDSYAVALYEEKFPQAEVIKETKPTTPSDSEEYNTDFSYTYSVSNGKKKTVVDFTDKNGNKVHKEFEGDDADKAKEMVENKFNTNSKPLPLFPFFRLI